MSYQCKIFDKDGKLIRVIKEQSTSKNIEDILKQKSTHRAIETIKSFKQAKVTKLKGFYNKWCLHCRKEFHPRHKSAKYCSSECQKDYYRAARRKKMKARNKNSK